MTEFRWSKIPYPKMKIMLNDSVVPFEHVPLTFFRKYDGMQFNTLLGDPIAFQITYPDVTFDFRGFELNQVKRHLSQDSRYVKKIIDYWNPKSMLNSLIENTIILMNTYETSATNGARILSIMADAYADGIKICNYFKMAFDIPRPIQVDRYLKPVIETPYSPSYPSESGVCAGITEVLFEYFFELEKENVHKLINQCAYSSFNAGINYRIDVDEGIRLGKNIGEIIRDIISNEYDSIGCSIDLKMKNYKKAQLEFIK